MPRAYIHHSAATVRYLRRHYDRQPMRELAAALGIPLAKLQELARRQGIKKTRPAA